MATHDIRHSALSHAVDIEQDNWDFVILISDHSLVC